MEFILSKLESKVLTTYATQQGFSKLQATEELVEREMDRLTESDGTLLRDQMMNKVARYPASPNAINNEVANETSGILERLEASIRSRWITGKGKAPATMPETIIPALLTSALRRLWDEGAIRI